ncbi:subtilisin family serine protease [Tahibacter aquaticus]|uniref:Subtilisin family serine protease n=1 Tax=Tahibacter aquaticus TaxID=520092 RepID=A0A4R6YRN1_9GAMM|nr:S8 family serine peptidase [Tahibacter aquaticus]TDR40739.1 subtilisin family serine protease [Tahibacter aquaticus]
MRKPLYIALLAALIGSSVTALAADSVRVRLDHAARNSLEALSITPLKREAYASFQILELSRADADKLVASTDRARILADAGRIRFNQVDFDPLQDPARIGNGFFPTTTAGEGLHLVQFDAPIKDSWREALQQRGLRVLQYYPGETYLVWGLIDNVAETVSLPHVRWQGGFLADYKINPDLHGRRGRIANVDVHFYNNGDVAGVVGALEKLGARVLTHAPAQPDKAFFDAWIEVDADRLADIARLPQVLALAYASPTIRYEDEMAAQIVAGNYNAANQPQTGYVPWLAGFGFNGNGATWAVVDTGVDLGHPDLSPRIVGGFSYPGCAAPNGDDEAGGGHGTHVAGIIAGMAIGDGGDATVDEDDANGFRYGQGLATGASIYAVCTGAAWPPDGGWQSLSKTSLSGNAIGMNASWHTGEPAPHGYQASERTFDMMIRDGDFDAAGNQPFIIAFSAGNGGPGASTITAPKEAKNPITTASSLNFRAGAIGNVSGFSSRGPALDGRVLPTIAAPGETIASTRRRAGATQCGTPIAGTNGYYSNCSGTSMAAPQVSGTLAILAQWWRGNHAGATFSPAMAKALLINGAIDMTAADVPNNNEGWGRINLPRTTGGGVPRQMLDQTVILDNAGDAHVLSVGISDPTRPVRISLAWTDAPGAVGASPALVNDLDLEVDNGANLYKGNVMAAGVSTTGGTADAKNNLENVFLPAGTSGSLTVRVRATALPGDGVPGTGDATDQDFALICDNCSLVSNYSLAATPSAMEVCAPAGAASTINVGSILGYNTPVALTTSNVPAGATLNVSPASVVPGNSATATFAPGSAAAGSYVMNVDASSASGNQSLPLSLVLATVTPAVPALTAPADNATLVAATPTLSWSASAQTRNYTVEVATDAAFGAIVFTQNVIGTASSVTVAPALNSNTRYYWRVRAANICGTSANAPVFTFKTAPAPGDCADTQTPNLVFSNDIEGDMSTWATTGSTGASTWAVSTARPFSPTKSWLAADLASTSDQRLISPAITLPAGQSPLTLSFQSDLNLEPRTAGGCWDGGLLEVSTNDGSSWTQVPNAQLLTDPYTGALNDGPGNGLQAWCGARAYKKSVVDLNSYAGQTVRFRFRVSSDSSVGLAPHGWYVDDVKVQGCSAAPVDQIFRNSFEP